MVAIPDFCHDFCRCGNRFPGCLCVVGIKEGGVHRNTDIEKNALKKYLQHIFFYNYLTPNAPIKFYLSFYCII